MVLSRTVTEWNETSVRGMFLGLKNLQKYSVWYDLQKAKKKYPMNFLFVKTNGKTGKHF